MSASQVIGDFNEEELYGAVLGSGRTQRTDVNQQPSSKPFPGAGNALLQGMFAQAQQGMGASKEVLPAMPTGAVHAGEHGTASQGGPGAVADKTTQERLKVRNILSQDRMGGKKDSNQLSPEVKAQFADFKEQKQVEAQATREAMTASLRNFSSQEKKKVILTLQPPEP